MCHDRDARGEGAVQGFLLFGDFSWQEEVLAGSMECVLGVLLLPWDPCQIKGTDATAFYVTDPRSGLPGRTGLWAGTGPLLRWPSVSPLPPSPDKPHREKAGETRSPNPVACACTQLLKIKSPNCGSSITGNRKCIECGQQWEGAGQTHFDSCMTMSSGCTRTTLAANAIITPISQMRKPRLGETGDLESISDGLAI